MMKHVFKVPRAIFVPQNEHKVKKIYETVSIHPSIFLHLLIRTQVAGSAGA